ncbi:TPA: hypothetical protein PIO38_003530, partial [Klebsiella pneumoniae]|nr:hypothetical protein [Klebsiella pneumoniae]HBR2070478.1 hypothetical protein [Klebsiella pneumoniae]HDH0402213.1 hypothetical protein [Klebsiella pneumoniae]
SEEPILPDGLFAFLSSGQRAGISPPVALRLPGLQNRTPDKVRSTAFIASQNSVTNACGMVNRIVNLPDDTSRKIIISSYD